MSTIAEMMVKLGLNASGYTSGLQGAAAETKKFQDQLKQVQKTGEGISKVGTAITTGVTLPVIAAGTALTKFALDAQKSIQIERSFNAVAKSAGYMGDEMLLALQKSSRGLITNTDLMKNFNMAASLVSTQFATKLPEAFEYLGKVSASTGQSMDYMLDSLVRGVGRLSPLILDNLGIQVSLNEAYEEWATVNGRAVDSMTKTEQQMAVMDQVMSKLKENTAGMSDEFGTTGERIKTSMENAKDSIGRNLVPALESAGEKLTEVIGKFGSLFDEGQALNPVITATGDVLGKLATGISNVVDWLGQLNPATVTTVVNIALIAAAAGPVIFALGKIISIGASVISTLANIGAAFGLAGGAAAIAGGIVAAAAAAFGIFMLKAHEAANSIKDVQNAALAAGLSFESYKTSLIGAGHATAEGSMGAKEYASRGIAVREMLMSMVQAGTITEQAMNSLSSQYARGRITLDEYERRAYELAQTHYVVEESVTGTEDALNGIIEAIEETTEATKQLTTAELEQNSQLAFIHDNLTTYQTMLGNLKKAKEEYEALPHWQQDGEKGQELIGIIQGIETEFDKMLARATAQELYNAIMENGYATRQEMESYLGYLKATGLATEEELDFLMRQWEELEKLRDNLTRDAEGNVTINVGIEGEESTRRKIAEIREALASIERNIGVTVTVTQIGRYLTGPIREYGRALGGPVEANTTYLVGERGAELFVPEVDGKIIPHHEMNKYVQKGNPESVSASFDSFEDNDSPEMVQNVYNLTLNTTANESGIITAFRMMEALNS